MLDRCSETTDAPTPLPPLLGSLWALLRAYRSAFRQERSFHRMQALILGHIFSFARRTITQALVALGLTDHDWSSFYRLFNEPRIDYEELTGCFLSETLEHVPVADPYVTNNVLGCSGEKIDLNSSIKGYTLTGSDYVGVVPVCVREGDEWNVDTLSSFIGGYLPQSARLDFYQAQQRKGLLQQVSTSIVGRFSGIAATIGTAPVPVADIAVLTPLQILMVALVAGLSCRPFSLDSVWEFAAASGVTVGASFGARQLARQFVKLVPVAGALASGTIAGASTYGIGKAAEAYFFYGEMKKPETFAQGLLPW